MYTKNNIFCFFISLCILVLVTFSMGIKATAASLILEDQSGEEGNTVTFTVSIDNAPNNVAALGFHVQYDPSVLSYKGYSAGSLTSSFDFFGANNASPGTVRVGGFVAGSGKIDEGESGTAVSLAFDVVGHEDCEVRLAQLKDDIKSWNTEPGYFSGDPAVEEELADNPTSPPVEEEPASPVPPPDSLIAEEVASNPSTAPAIPSLGHESYGNPSFSSAGPSMEREQGDNEAPPSSGAHIRGSFYNNRYRRDIFHPQADQPTSKETSKSVRAQPNIHRRAEAGKSHQSTRVAKPTDNQEALMLARAMPKVNQTAAYLNTLPDRSHSQAQFRAYLGEISDSKEVQNDGLRLLIAMMILFGSMYYLAIGSSILFVGYLFWELIKIGRRQLVGK